MEKGNLDYAGVTCYCFLQEEERGNLALFRNAGGIIAITCSPCFFSLKVQPHDIGIRTNIASEKLICLIEVPPGVWLKVPTLSW